MFKRWDIIKNNQNELGVVKYSDKEVVLVKFGDDTHAIFYPNGCDKDKNIELTHNE